MAERIYHGVKFRTEFAKGRMARKVDSGLIKELVAWGKVLDRLSRPKVFATEGNMSLRTPRGCLITRAGVNLGNLRVEDFVEVVGWDFERWQVRCFGTQYPSSETMVHLAIYSSTEWCQFIFHCHDKVVVEFGHLIGLPITRRVVPYGTPGLVKEVRQILDGSSYYVLRNHGVCSLGRTPEEAGQGLKTIHKEVLKFKKLKAD